MQQKNIRVIGFLIILLFSTGAGAQYKMKQAEDLINNPEQVWPIMQHWIDSAKNKVEVLPCTKENAIRSVYLSQITTGSTLGAIIFHTGGILVDHGWLRILGAGCNKMKRSIPEWNKGKSFENDGNIPDFWLVADDAVGGYFAINGGALGTDTNKVYYLSPETLVWESLDLTYTEFINFSFNGDLKTFYGSLRWTNWERDVKKLHPDMVYHFYPYLWTSEGKVIEKNKRNVIPVGEQYFFNIESRKKIGLENVVRPSGTNVPQ